MGWWIAAGVLGGLSIVGSTTIATMRCPHVLIAVVQLLTPLWTVLCAVLAVVAAIATAWGPAAIALCGAAVGLVIMWPRLHRSSRQDRLVEREPNCSVALANLYLDNPEPDAAIEQLFEANPDILVMTELSVELLAQFDRLGGAERFPNRIHPDPIDGEYEVGIFTAHPMVDDEVTHRGELKVVDARVDLGDGRSLLVLAVHPVAPANSEDFRLWKRQLEELRGLLADTESGPTIALGDLNAGTLQPPYERLMRTEFRDAHDELGVALKPSWGIAPWLPRWLPTVLARLDHLLLSPGVEIASIEDLDPVGSDHRPFLAQLVVSQG